MKIATVDLETYWAVGHSLTKMSPIAYCMHPDTEIISCAFKFGSAPTVVVFGEPAVKNYCAKVDWSKYMVVGHNMSAFDSMILSWRLNVKPMVWGCTLAMARPFHSKDVGLSLAKLVAHYGLGVKNQSVLLATKGRHLCDFTTEEIDDMRIYNAADVDQCYELFKRLYSKLQKTLGPDQCRDELKLIDMTVRMLVEPSFDADMPLLVHTLADEGARKLAMLAHASTIMGVREDDTTEQEAADAALTVLASAGKFAQFLQTIGVDVPTKPSPSNPETLIPALAKTDEGFLALQEHEDPLVATAAAARLDAKSTILQTRVQSFIDAATAHPNSKVPIPLRYYGADTTGRWSGWGYNPQNLPRVKGAPSDALRNSLLAPPGHKVVVADLSGIEMRVNHFFWNVSSSVKLFENDPQADLYKDFAATLYEVPVSEVTKDQRQVGKVAHLGLGYQSGWETFQKFAKTQGGVILSEKRSRDIVTTWRSLYSDIKEGWYKCHSALSTIRDGNEGAPVDPWGMVFPTKEGLRTPKGVIRYPDLREQDSTREGWEDSKEFVYAHGRNKANLYGGKMNENIVQHLAKCIIADNALDVQGHTNLVPALMVHDELVYIVPEDEAQIVLDVVQAIMRKPPIWWPELVTWSEGSTADSYGEAK